MRLLAFLVLFGAVAVTVSSATRYMLAANKLSQGYVDVTFAQRKCLSKNSESVPVILTGVAYETGLPRKSFNSFTRFNKMDGVKGDERGHLVASTFGGLNDDSWNMVPQHVSVNRKISKMSNIMARWDEFEKWASVQLGRNKSVQFKITVNYEDAKGCRPVSFEVDAKSSYSKDSFQGKFINSPDDNFATVAQTQAQMKRKKP
ncbi:uncharacterized protein LOC132917258 [Rhopalosiphum padi]|uniref:uncharacterized protein LOC132917258 n=1 Tax=Rhopalosiphum padi TaxID=40932 RepID=UPI00298E2AB9|nr:uncharacterized protein LOC132917258 [Rhopalosiphum padi]